MADKLMPCPFCGGEKLSIQSDHFGATWISCDSCNARGPAPGKGERDVEVIALWNKRLADERVRAERDRLIISLRGCGEVAKYAWDIERAKVLEARDLISRVLTMQDCGSLEEHCGAMNCAHCDARALLKETT